MLDSRVTWQWTRGFLSPLAKTFFFTLSRHNVKKKERWHESENPLVQNHRVRMHVREVPHDELNYGSQHSPPSRE